MKILIFGDSHSRYFNLTNELCNIDERFKGIDISVTTIPGLSVRGFGKRNSTLNSMEKLTMLIDKKVPEKLVFAIGQVDIELGYYYKKIIKDDPITFNEFIKPLVDEYFSQIENISKQKNLPSHSIIIKGINHSTLTVFRDKAINYTSRVITENIDDLKDVEQYKNKLNEIFPSSMERISNHSKLNKLYKEKSEMYGYKYFDINEEISQSGFIFHSYLPTAQDHHLVDSLETRIIHINKLLETIFDN
jgi:hypothetical protein